MPLIKTPGAAPIFFSFPLLNSFADSAAQIVATSMQALVHRIYQLDPSAYWQGSLGASDAQTEIITMGLYKGSLLNSASIDSFLILNNNLANFVIEYCTDYVAGAGGAAGAGTWTAVTGGTVTGNTSTDFQLFLASPITANGLRLTMTTTITPNQQKVVGCFIPMLSTFQLSNPPSKFVPVARQKRLDVILADGTIDTTFFYWSDNSFTLFDLEFEFDYLNISNSTDKSNLDAIFLSPNAFMVYPEPGDTPRAIYLGIFDSGSYLPNFNTQWKGGGRKIPFRIKQVGYL